jgi:8-oxo-dGTP pyrophosphatase MutT (NUDIX family)
MTQMYKVFFYDRTLFLTDQIGRDLGNHFNAIHKYSTPHDLELFISQFESRTELKTGHLYHHNLDELFKHFCNCYTLIEAAGGVVQNENGELLFIHRLGKWDLPKGKLEPNENPTQAALREVEEECGIRNLFLGDKITETYHTYSLQSTRILKKTHWYKMTTQGNQQLTPQQEEHITEATWVSPEKVNALFLNSYPSVIEVINQYLKNDNS